MCATVDWVNLSAVAAAVCKHLNAVSLTSSACVVNFRLLTFLLCHGCRADLECSVNDRRVPSSIPHLWGFVLKLISLAWFDHQSSPTCMGVRRELSREIKITYKNYFRHVKDFDFFILCTNFKSSVLYMNMYNASTEGAGETLGLVCTKT